MSQAPRETGFYLVRFRGGSGRDALGWMAAFYDQIHGMMRVQLVERRCPPGLFDPDLFEFREMERWPLDAQVPVVPTGRRSCTRIVRCGKPAVEFRPNGAAYCHPCARFTAEVHTKPNLVEIAERICRAVFESWGQSWDGDVSAEDQASIRADVLVELRNLDRETYRRAVEELV